MAPLWRGYTRNATKLRPQRTVRDLSKPIRRRRLLDTKASYRDEPARAAEVPERAGFTCRPPTVPIEGRTDREGRPTELGNLAALGLTS
jgi:hypothetical protein